MASIAPFDLEAALSGSVKHVGAIKWVAPHPIAVEAIAPYSDDENLAIVTAAGHGAKQGEKVFLGSFGFMVDGFYEVVDHPLEGVDRNKYFAIAMPEELRGRRLTGGLLYRPAEFSVFHPDHLPLGGTAELKKLGLDKATNLRAQSKYQGTIEDIGLVQAEIFKLIDSVKVAVKDRDRIRGALEALAGISDELLIDTAIADIKKEFKITKKTFADDAKRVSRQLAETAKSVELDPEALTEAFVRRAMELRKREIEILCQMPDGLMSALDNMSRMESVLNSMYEYVAAAIEEASTGNEEPMDQRKEKP